MKQRLLFLVPVFLVVLLFSCRKERNPQLPASEVLLKMQAHKWVLDSATYYYPFTTSTLHFDSVGGKGTMYIDSDWYVEKNSVNTYKYFYEFEDSNKLYFWNPSDLKNLSTFYLIDSVTESSLTMKRLFSDYTLECYWHAE
jgi:hypothetical protein